MVLPAIALTGLRVAPLLLRFAPRVKAVGLKALTLGVQAVKFVLPKTRRGILITAGTLPTLVGAGVTPTGRAILKGIFDPRIGFKRGKEFLEERPEEEKVSLIEGATKVGTAGLIGAGAIITGKKVIEEVKKRRAKKEPEEKVLTQEDIQKVTPIEDVGKQIEEPTLGAVPKPKEEIIPKVQPLTIKNVFTPSIDIRFSKSRKFINQQLLIRR